MSSHHPRPATHLCKPAFMAGADHRAGIVLFWMHGLQWLGTRLLSETPIVQKPFELAAIRSPCGPEKEPVP
jgi:hypothetical protein